MIAAFGAVDYVVIFDEKRVDNLLREVRPRVYAKGGDYTLEQPGPGRGGGTEGDRRKNRNFAIGPGQIDFEDH